MKISIEVLDDKIKLEKSEDMDPITAARLLAEACARILAPFKAEVVEKPKIIKPNFTSVPGAK